MARYKRFGAALPATDFERAKAWYAEKLGLRPTEDSPEGGIFDDGRPKVAWSKDSEGNILSMSQPVA